MAKVKGSNYVAANEMFDKKMAKKDMKSMKTAGVAKALKKAKKEEGYSKMPKVKAQKKMMKPISGNKKVY